jgi:acetyl esterase/lipase
MRVWFTRRFTLAILPLALRAAEYRIDCAAPQWRSLDAVNRLRLGPGDRLLLHAGCRWTGTLHPQGSGSAAAPITVDRYGEGRAPAIEGGGGETAVLLRNQEFWEIAGLEITNDAPEQGSRRGGLVRAENCGGALHHIYLRRLEIHNVKGKLGADIVSKNTGGIGLEVITRQKPCRLDDVRIENNHLSGIDNTGIYLQTDSSPHPRDPNWDQLRNTGVVIRGNVLEDIGKNAIGVRASLEPLIERNIVRNAAARLHGNAIYVFGCKNAVMQYNEVTGTKYPGLEGAGFDSDYNSEGTIIQYNYSHGNGGGLADICNNPQSRPPRGYNDGTIVRYNVSRDETDRVIAFDGPATNTEIYNNTLYIGAGFHPHIIEFDIFGKAPGYPDRTVIRDNIVVNEGEGTYLYGKATNTRFAGNCFAGKHPEDEPADPGKKATDSAYQCPAGAGAIQPATLVFGQADGMELKADLYLPQGPGPFPAALYLHGGGWTGGDRTQLKRQAAYLASFGVLGLAIEYRLAPESTYPAQIDDARAGVRWLRENRGKYRIDTNRIFAVGSSAGGHLAAMLGAMGDVTAVITFNPVLDLTSLSGGSSITKLLGGSCQERPELCRQASPVYRVSGRSAPMLILHGTVDQTVPYSQATAMLEKLKAAGVRAELFTAEGGPHTFWANPRWYQGWQDAVVRFLGPYLGR